MDFDSAVGSLRTSCGRPPASALRAAAECPGELIAAVSVFLELGTTGELLIPEEEHLLFSGLYVLAEGRRCEVLPLLCRFLRASPGLVEGVFDEDFTHLNGILYSLGAEDAGPLFELGADTGAQDDARGAAISALGRLVAEDRADRDRFVQLLDGFDRMVVRQGSGPIVHGRRRFLRCSYESSFRACGLPSRRVCFRGPTRTGRNGLSIWMI